MSTNRLNPSGMTKIIDGKRYTVSTSTLLADNDYWGRNTLLYKTRGGAFFQVDMTCWQGERDTINVLTRDEAIELYERLPEQYIDFETAFDAVVEEASAGRPALYDKPMKQTAVWLPEEMLEWLKAQPGSMSDQLRAMIEEKMQHEPK